ncbi:MAG: YggS family pyridoxal phosphate-dependent enzyme [Chitinophagales bacterium]|nr:YggS family pyridoxal phosphate-dependent enzyme [Chitinophagales bacterium]
MLSLLLPKNMQPADMVYENYQRICAELKPYGCRLVAVTKNRSAEEVMALYRAGQRIFGENRVQELCAKRTQLPHDAEWHLIGHLQTNKVKYIAPFVKLIHSVDSMKLLKEIERQACKCNRKIDVLLQIFIAEEETKFGMSTEEAESLLSSGDYRSMSYVRIVGLMGMATNTRDEAKVDKEFAGLKNFFEYLKTQYFGNIPAFKELSMGMSQDYKIALRHGATYVRLGSILFGE